MEAISISFASRKVRSSPNRDKAWNTWPLSTLGTRLPPSVTGYLSKANNHPPSATPPMTQYFLNLSVNKVIKKR